MKAWNKALLGLIVGASIFSSSVYAAEDHSMHMSQEARDVIA